MTPGTACCNRASSCLERFAQDGRVRVRLPNSSQQVHFNRALHSGNNFVAYVDAMGELDGTPCVQEWKTASARYPEEPAGLSALDPQLVCYSWMTGIDEVAQVVFVRKRLVEAHMDGENPEILISRYYRFLPCAQRQEFLSEIAREAS